MDVLPVDRVQTGDTGDTASRFQPRDAVMKGAAWFHVTGITPALGDTAAATTRVAVDAAKRAGALTG